MVRNGDTVSPIINKSLVLQNLSQRPLGTPADLRVPQAVPSYTDSGDEQDGWFLRRNSSGGTTNNGPKENVPCFPQVLTWMGAIPPMTLRDPVALAGPTPHPSAFQLF